MQPNAGAAGSAGVEVAQLDSSGVIVSVNTAWNNFCLDNDGDLGRSGIGISYLEMCSTVDDEGARLVKFAIESALAGELAAPVTVEIPCDSPEQPRWYDVLVSSRFDRTGRCAGATVTLSPSRASRQPKKSFTGLGDHVSYPDVPRIEMENLVAELAERVQEVIGAQARMRSLLNAGSRLAAESKLSTVIDLIETLACELIDAKSARVRLLGDGYEPPATPCLGIAIHARGDLFGTLYLTDSAYGDFSTEDEWLAKALAVSAGIAIDNTLMFADSERRRRWQTATLAACDAITADDSVRPLDIVSRYAAMGGQADVAHVSVHDDGGAVRVEASFGVGADELLGRCEAIDETAIGPVLRDRTALLTDDLIAAPLTGDDAAVRAITVGRLSAIDSFESADLDQLLAYAHLVGLALRLRARARVPIGDEI